MEVPGASGRRRQAKGAARLELVPNSCGSSAGTGLPAVNLYDGSLGRTLCERRPAFFKEWLRCAREQQQQVDGGGRQAASQNTGRPQVELLNRGAASEEHSGDQGTSRYLKGQGKVCR